MTQDGFPIYDESESHPGAFVLCCHSGVTLCANHALTVAPMIARGALDKSLVAPFSARRFHVQAGWVTPATAVTLKVDGKPIRARAGDTVAAAMLAAGIDHCRTTPVTGAPRAPYCLMGVCFDCLVTIDGVGSRQGCLVPVREGMAVETQLGKREAGR